MCSCCARTICSCCVRIISSCCAQAICSWCRTLDRLPSNNHKPRKSRNGAEARKYINAGNFERCVFLTLYVIFFFLVSLRSFLLCGASRLFHVRLLFSYLTRTLFDENMCSDSSSWHDWMGHFMVQDEDICGPRWWQSSHIHLKCIVWRVSWKHWTDGILNALRGLSCAKLMTSS